MFWVLVGWFDLIVCFRSFLYFVVPVAVVCSFGLLCFACLAGGFSFGVA